MILYRLASEDDNSVLIPPRSTIYQRDSVVSTSDQSIFSLSADSKYPSGLVTSTRGLVPYAYDPETETELGTDEDDLLHEPDNKDKQSLYMWSGRGWLNVGALLLLIVALLSLFICYPVVSYYNLNAYNALVAGNTHINSNGQIDSFQNPGSSFPMRTLIDPDTPSDARSRTGWDGEAYSLVFSDEFTKEGRSFYPGDDPYWEAVDLWYGVTADQEWYDPAQITTKGGALQILLEQVPDPSLNHGLSYKSGMLQSWNKFCFTSGYVEVSVTFPGPNSNTQGYWPGIWTMGNLGRPGYGATTDGLWPYSYNTCDLGTFPNQTLPDGSGPAAALNTTAGRAKYDYRLSWLPGQRVSSCTCPNEEHPGPSHNKGRGAPEIDVLEAERNKTGPYGGVVSQSAQFAPFTHDYLFIQDATNEYQIYDPSMTVQNDYKGSAVQQAVSALTKVPDNMYQGSGQQFTKFGFEYWANPSNPSEGFITWMSNGQPTQRLSAAAMAADQGPTGSQVSQRLIPEEPMSIIMNLGVSANWQNIDLTTMTFPTVMLVDYVRVYQRTSNQNIGCSPPDYPTADYIKAHMAAYTNANLTQWRSGVQGGAGYSWPKNQLYEQQQGGSC